MANSKNNKKKVEVKKGKKTEVKKKGNKVQVTLGKKIIIAIIAVILIAAIAFGVLYFAFPDLYDRLRLMLFGDPWQLPPTDLEGDILQVHFLDIGQGDNIIIKFPDDKVMMIDAGSSSKTSSGETAKTKALNYLKRLNIKTIDYMLLTHTDADHCNFMVDIIDAVEVKEFYFPMLDALPANGTPTNQNGTIYTNVYYQLMQAVKTETYTENGVTKNATLKYNVDIYEIMGDGYSLKSYCYDEDYYKTTNFNTAEKKNRISPVTILEFGDVTRKVMFTGDITAQGEKNFFEKSKNDDIDVDVLKIAHHGGDNETTMDFLEYVDPEYAVISCGAKSQYGHPGDNLLKRLQDYRDKPPYNDYNGIIDTYITHEQGDIILYVGSENGGMEFHTERDNTSKQTKENRPLDVVIRVTRIEVQFEMVQTEA